MRGGDERVANCAKDVVVVLCKDCWNDDRCIPVTAGIRIGVAMSRLSGRLFWPKCDTRSGIPRAGGLDF